MNQLEQLLPLACAWVSEQEEFILKSGVPLSESQMRDAALAGVDGELVVDAAAADPEHFGRSRLVALVGRGGREALLVGRVDKRQVRGGVAAGAPRDAAVGKRRPGTSVPGLDADRVSAGVRGCEASALRVAVDHQTS